ncbi:MAG: hypothetical protein EOO09_18460 [Chitinophagaceae bacterium]|nr:MAG: hypothetical protein EOO09_18460 [Chitinophagaceae bacterium]
MKTTLIMMAIALLNLYKTAGKQETLFAGIGRETFVAAGNSVQPRLRTAADTGTYRPSPAALKNAQDGQQVELSFSSFGCFNQYARKLVFRNTPEGVTVALYNTRPSGIGQSPEGELLVTRLMTATDWDAWQEFEAGLYTVRHGGCTTMERYVLSDSGGSSTVTDASCEWFGFNKLMTGLFGKTDPGVKMVR